MNKGVTTPWVQFRMDDADYSGFEYGGLVMWLIACSCVLLGSLINPVPQSER
jgi:hypothetical protein